MVRALLIALALSGCVYDYDGAFGVTGGNAGSSPSPAGGDGGMTHGGEGGVASDGGAPTTTTTTTDATVTSTSTGAVCVCAPPGTCVGDVCQCPGSVSLEVFATIGEGTSGSFQGWSSSAFAAAPDGNAASVVLGNGQTSEQLTARGFDFSSVPNDALLLNQITVTIDRCRTVETSPVDVVDSYLRLSNAGTAISGPVNPGTWGMCGGAGGTYAFPVTGIGPAQLKNDFGVQLRAQNQANGSATGYVNSFKVGITYQPTCVP